MSQEANLPFAGIPPEMLDRTNALIEEEPDFLILKYLFHIKMLLLELLLCGLFFLLINLDFFLRLY